MRVMKKVGALLTLCLVLLFGGSVSAYSDAQREPPKPQPQEVSMKVEKIDDHVNPISGKTFKITVTIWKSDTWAATVFNAAMKTISTGTR